MGLALQFLGPAMLILVLAVQFVGLGSIRTFIEFLQCFAQAGQRFRVSHTDYLLFSGFTHALEGWEALVG